MNFYFLLLRKTLLIASNEGNLHFSAAVFPQHSAQWPELKMGKPEENSTHCGPGAQGEGTFLFCLFGDCWKPMFISMDLVEELQPGEKFSNYLRSSVRRWLVWNQKWKILFCKMKLVFRLYEIVLENCSELCWRVHKKLTDWFNIWAAGSGRSTCRMRDFPSFFSIFRTCVVFRLAVSEAVSHLVICIFSTQISESHAERI